MKLPKILSWSVRVMLAITFVISGLMKLYPIEFFENDLLLHHLSPEKLVLFESRLLIGSELFIAAGILLALNDKIFLRLSFLMLIVYTIYLFILILVEGNEGNCGCFGNAIILTPFEGILKNVFLLGMTWLVWKNQVNYSLRYKKITIGLMTAITLALPFILNPVLLPKTIESNGIEKTLLPLEILYETEGETPPMFDVKQGKKIVAFLLLRCPHCRLAATRLEAIKRDHPELPIYIILTGEANDIPDFIEESKLHDIPYQHFIAQHKVMKIAGAEFPQIMLIHDSMLEGSLDYYDITSESLLNWMNQP